MSLFPRCGIVVVERIRELVRYQIVFHMSLKPFAPSHANRRPAGGTVSSPSAGKERLPGKAVCQS